MDCIEIIIVKNGRHQLAQLLCDSKNLTITFVLDDEYSKAYSGSDLYDCFGLVRKDNSNLTFLCKGSKVNVHPSTMSSQMTLGVKAYELTMGKSAQRSDLVNIFDYEEDNLTNDPEVQHDFYMRWVESDLLDS